MSRDSSHQGPPKTTLENFPARDLPIGASYFRCHRNDLGEWYYATAKKLGEGGRWDLGAPEGTCYLAADRTGALLEVVGPDHHDTGFVVSDVLAGRRVTDMTLPAATAAADLRATGVSSHGATTELTGALPYKITQQWASAWRAAGFGGVVYELRFHPNSEGVALFGPTGPADHPTTGSWVPAADVAADLQLNVVDPPSSDQLTIVAISSGGRRLGRRGMK